MQKARWGSAGEGEGLIHLLPGVPVAMGPGTEGSCGNSSLSLVDRWPSAPTALLNPTFTPHTRLSWGLVRSHLMWSFGERSFWDKGLPLPVQSSGKQGPGTSGRKEGWTAAGGGHPPRERV